MLFSAQKCFLKGTHMLALTDAERRHMKIKLPNKHTVSLFFRAGEYALFIRSLHSGASFVTEN